MSRRRGEFEHRTSIFEGAFRAWSHLGGLEPEDLEGKAQDQLDPLTNPIQNDFRNNGKNDKGANPIRRKYPYEPLPRSGLTHPYVQAILSPWLGPGADNDAIQLGLTTLRTWWQHRRKGESGSAIAALGTEKMKGVVEGYTRHFFQLSYCLIMNDKEQPPRSLYTKMKELDKMRNKGSRNKKKSDGGSTMPSVTKKNALTTEIEADLLNKNLSPLEQLHRAQQRQLAGDGGIQSRVPTPNAIINMKNKCLPGAINLPEVVNAVNHHANQLAHSGVSNRNNRVPPIVPSAVVSASQQPSASEYGDPNLIPIVFISRNIDIMLAMSIDGITCAHCVKIVETVLKGCNGNKSPIDGLLDAAADRVLNSVLLKIDKLSNAKRIAFEAARNLAMVGYTANAKELSSSIDQNGKKSSIPVESFYKAFEDVARSDPKEIFDWEIHCSCPDNGVLREDCLRYVRLEYESTTELPRLVSACTYIFSFVFFSQAFSNEPKHF
jgi:copper chaperone CopZ